VNNTGGRQLDPQCGGIAVFVLEEKGGTGDRGRYARALGGRAHEAVGADDGHGEECLVGEHALGPHLLDQARLARMLPAVFELHRDLVHLREGAGHVLLIGLRVGIGFLQHQRIGAFGFRIGARPGHGGPQDGEEAVGTGKRGRSGFDHARHTPQGRKVSGDPQGSRATPGRASA
jgi:hypothetical protein